MKPGEVIYQGKTKKGSEIIVRYPTLDDVTPMMNYMNTISKEQTFITFQGEQLTQKEEQTYLEDILKKMKDGKAVKLFVFKDHQLIGVSDIIMQERTFAHVGIFGLTIANNYREEGIGQLLMELIVSEAKKHIAQLKIISLGVFANNPAAIHIYKKFGFVESGKIPQGIKYKDQFIDHIFMYKILE